jgi:hypothetical protein
VAEGAGDQGRIWYSNAALELLDDRFLWDMVRADQRGMGVAKKIAKNLYDATLEFGLSRITVATEDVGSYLWARAGFIPERASWQGLKVDLYRRFVSLRRHMSQDSARLVEGIIAGDAHDDPFLVQVIARLDDRVPARVTRDPMNPEMVELGKEMLVGLHWVGNLDVATEIRRRRFEEWLRE